MNSRASSPNASPSPRPDNDAILNRSSSPSISPEARPTSQDSSSLDPDLSLQSFEAEAEQRHPKGKRKRTAAKDKAILESAYHANPKPDKAARLDIVKRVSLNEKEVQIWFQNRRQNDRRKSRPLSPQEIAALRYGGMQILSSDPIMYGGVGDVHLGSDGAHPGPDTSFGVSPTQSLALSERKVPSPNMSDAAVHASSDEAEKQDKPAGEQVERRDLDSDAAAVEAGTPAQKTQPHDGSSGLSQSFSSSMGYLANRWNAGSSFSTPATLNRHGDDSFKLESFPSSACSISSAPVLPLPTPSQSSQFRLSLSLEGKAEVISNTSPPHLLAPRPSAEALQALGRPPRAGLHRSQSASSASGAGVTLPPFSALANSLASGPSGASPGHMPPRLSRGRSRDTRAWELAACDAENREDELIVQAKHESTGSAIAAISLLRSTSSCSSPTVGGPLQPASSAKRNASNRSALRPGGAKKAKLGRAASSYGRMQTVGGGVMSSGREKFGPMVEDKNKPGSEKVKVSMLLSPSCNDSDKENWSPDEDGHPHPSRRRGDRSGHPPHPHSTTGARKPLPSASSTSRHDQHFSTSRRTLGHLNRDRLAGPSFLAGIGRSSTAPTSGRHRSKRGASPLEIFEDAAERGDDEADGGPPKDAGRRRGRPMVDDEVERFMRGEVSPSKKGDVDAVAGLLSLSQGNWR